MPQPRWLQYIDEKIKMADVVESPEEASPFGQFRELLEAYLLSGNRRATDRDEVVLGKPFLDEEERLYIFKATGLYEFLNERRFKYENTHQIWLWLRQVGASPGVQKIRGKAMNVWTLPEARIKPLETGSPGQVGV